ncbi:hypothetical protein BS47DRAFT_1317306 [Hydnum rufescens UP504]|uniref:Pex19 protein n=1 Tax=Hydnum rufescens UP504 TaxID=1448309 RepID=A0A9P6AXJ2_9AGAM|nr:hypothetical protein BS47DRAFT_1317306 [Hydnum rufescens UP504]
MSKDLGKTPAPPNDPDEDVDDLDDVLDQFNPAPRPVPQPPAKPPPPTTAADVPNAGPSQSSSPDALSEDFAEQLAAGMEALMRDLGKPSSSGEDSEAQASWEKILIAGMEEASRGGVDLFGAPDSTAPGKAPAGPARVEDPPPNVDGFQKKILEAMQKLKTSEDNLQSDSSNPSDPLAKLLADLDLGALDDADGQGANEGDFQTMVEGMMTQLMSKDILYDPLKELQEKFPAYLSKNEAVLSAEDKTRYTNQLSKVHEIVAVFERRDYKDDDPAQSTKILGLMNEMQSLGSPPEEIMGELPPGMNLNSDGLPGPEGCIIA